MADSPGSRARILAALLLAAAVVVPAPLYLAVPAAAQASQASASPAYRGGAGEDSLAVYIARVSRFMNVTLRLADSYNITLNSTLQDRTAQARDDLAQARQALAAGERLRAARLATQASLEFAPVARYVWSRLPGDARSQLAAEAILRAVNARIQALQRLEARLAAVENLTGADLSRLLAAINQTIAVLEQARDSAQTGQLAEARALLAAATRQLTVEARLALAEARPQLALAARLAAAVGEVARHTLQLDRAINRTLAAAGEDRLSSEQLARLSAAFAASSSALLARVEWLEALYTPRGGNDTLYQALIVLEGALNESRALLLQAQEAAEANNTDAAIGNLTLAYQTLATALESLRGLNLPGECRAAIRQAHALNESMERYARRLGAQLAAALSLQLDRDWARLRALYHAYQDGRVPAWRVRAAFAAEEAKLARLQDAGWLPPWLHAKIGAFMSWLESHTP